MRPHRPFLPPPRGFAAACRLLQFTLDRLAFDHLEALILAAERVFSDPAQPVQRDPSGRTCMQYILGPVDGKVVQAARIVARGIRRVQRAGELLVQSADSPPAASDATKLCTDADTLLEALEAIPGLEGGDYLDDVLETSDALLRPDGRFWTWQRQADGLSKRLAITARAFASAESSPRATVPAPAALDLDRLPKAFTDAELFPGRLPPDDVEPIGPKTWSQLAKALGVSEPTAKDRLGGAWEKIGGQIYVHPGRIKHPTIRMKILSLENGAKPLGAGCARNPKGFTTETQRTRRRF
jgi:hypothetical protein